MNRKATMLIVVLLIGGFIGMALVFLGEIPAVVFAVASIGGFILRLFTTYRTPIDTQKVIVPYLLAVIFLSLMFMKNI